MILQNSFSQTPFYCLVSPRFTLVKTGHFYWYTIAYETALNEQHLDYFVVTPTLKNAEFLNTKPNWREVDTKSQWGNDAGFANPLVLANKLEQVIKEIDKTRPIVVFGFESSFSMVLALLRLSKKYPNLQIGVNLLDSGFWSQLFSIENRGKRFLAKCFANLIKSQGGRFVLFGNSKSNACELSKILGQKVFEFPLPTITSRKILRPKFEKSQKTKIIMFISENEIQITKSFLNLVEESKLGEELNLVVHCKGSISYEALEPFANPNCRQSIEIVTGYLEKEEYEGLIESSDVALISYLDLAHIGAGSGKAMDALGLGVPIIALEGSHACQMGCAVGGCFPFKDGSATSMIRAIQSYIANDALGDEQDFSRNIKLQQRVNREMGVESSLIKLFSNFRSHSSNSFPSGLYPALIGYWFLVSRYQIFQLWRRCARKKIKNVNE